MGLSGVIQINQKINKKYFYLFLNLIIRRCTPRDLKVPLMRGVWGGMREITPSLYFLLYVEFFSMSDPQYQTFSTKLCIKLCKYV